MDRAVKALILIILLSLAVTLIVVYRTKYLYPVKYDISPPYVKPLNSSFVNGKFYISFLLNNTLPVPLNVSYGEVNITNTKTILYLTQDFTVPPKSIYYFNVSGVVPYELFFYQTAIVTGYLRILVGSSTGYITFAGSIPINVNLGIKVVNISFNGLTNYAFVTFQISTPVYGKLVSMNFIEVYDDSNGLLIFATDPPPFRLNSTYYNLSLIPGVNNVTVRVPVYYHPGDLEVKRGSLYTVVFSITIEYNTLQPIEKTFNITQTIFLG